METRVLQSREGKHYTDMKSELPDNPIPKIDKGYEMDASGTPSQIGNGALVELDSTEIRRVSEICSTPIYKPHHVEQT